MTFKKYPESNVQRCGCLNYGIYNNRDKEKRFITKLSDGFLKEQNATENFPDLT